VARRLHPTIKPALPQSIRPGQRQRWTMCDLGSTIRRKPVRPRRRALARRFPALISDNRSAGAVLWRIRLTLPATLAAGPRDESAPMSYDCQIPGDPRRKRGRHVHGTRFETVGVSLRAHWRRTLAVVGAALLGQLPAPPALPLRQPSSGERYRSWDSSFGLRSCSGERDKR
jgi:hypothetical protein